MVNKKCPPTQTSSQSPTQVTELVWRIALVEEARAALPRPQDRKRMNSTLTVHGSFPIH